MMKFEDYKKEFLLFLELERGYSEQTIDTYKRGIDRYLLFIKKKKINYLKISYYIFIIYIRKFNKKFWCAC